MIGVSNQQGTFEITKNEYELILALRQLQPRDKLVIVKQKPENRVELFVRIERAVLMPKEEPVDNSLK